MQVFCEEARCLCALRRGKVPVRTAERQVASVAERQVVGVLRRGRLLVCCGERTVWATYDHIPSRINDLLVRLIQVLVDQRLHCEHVSER